MMSLLSFLILLHCFFFFLPNQPDFRFIFKIFFGHAGGTWKFLGRRQNPSYCSSNTRALTYCATRETPRFIIFISPFKEIILGFIDFFFFFFLLFSISQTLLFFFFFFFFKFQPPFVFLRATPMAHGDSQARVVSELQPPAYTRATATPDPSCICDLRHSSRQHLILNPLSEARDQTCVLMGTSQICLC